ncbi:MAG TPA: hypothetical protein VGG04_18925 [Candidatus Sulfotelmatobacter sp.]|jgi:hypothetical protein
MSEGVLGIGHLRFGDQGFGGAHEAEWQEDFPKASICRPAGAWSAEKFAREQIRGLVRMVFSPNAPRPVRQVIFAAVDASTDVRGLCMSVAETLALETLGDIAVLGGYAQIVRDDLHNPESAGRMDNSRNPSLHQGATHLRSNLWLLPARQSQFDSPIVANGRSYLEEIRKQFEYSIVAAQSAEESGEALGMAQLADGIILVLSARNTRRATARKVKERLEQSHARLLGTVLSEREFPIPAAIYRRL